MYELLSVNQNEIGMCFRMGGTNAERHGAIGCFRADFGKNGGEFWSRWFDYQPYLKTQTFKTEFDNIINSLRNDGQIPPFSSRDSLSSFCASASDVESTVKHGAMLIRTRDFSYYFRCRPHVADYDIYCFAYDNSYLLPELEGKHELPNDCFGIFPSSGELIFIVLGEKGYYPSDKSTNDPEMNRQIETASNALLGVTRQQAEAMLAGSLLGWDKPAAKPWKYDMNDNPRLPLPKKDAPER